MSDDHLVTSVLAEGGVIAMAGGSGLGHGEECLLLLYSSSLCGEELARAW